MKNWKAIVGVIAVFLLGMLAGSLITIGVSRHRFHNGRRPQVVADLVVRKLGWELRLNASQREQLHGIVQASQEEIKAAHKLMQPQVEGILGRAEAKVRAILNPAQVVKFDKVVAERKARRLDEEK
jgi:hypothetical protein